MKQIRLLIAEDHTIVRQGLVNILCQYPDVCIVAEAEDGNAVVEKFYEFTPDVILSDVTMPHMDGFAAAKIILNKNKEAKVLFLSMFNSDEYIYRAVTIGASGYITKDVISHELIFALRTVASGEKYFMGKSEKEVKEVIERYKQNQTLVSPPNAAAITTREREVLTYIAKGMKSNEIAEKLYLSKRTVDAYRASLMEKLDVKSLPQLIKYAVELSFKKELP